MPCYDPGTEVKVHYINGVNPDPYVLKINQLRDRTKWLEAGLCALITELEKRGIANEVISQASKSGLIDLMKFWAEHSEEDEARIAKKLHEFSEHEQAVIKKLLRD